MGTQRKTDRSTPSVGQGTARTQRSASSSVRTTARSFSSVSTTLTAMQRSKADLQDELFRVVRRLERCKEKRRLKKRLPGVVEGAQTADERDYNDHLHSVCV